MAALRQAILFNSKWHQVALVRIARQRRDWPQVIVWGRRAFMKATTGNESEKYVERDAHHARDVQIRRKFKDA